MYHRNFHDYDDYDYEPETCGGAADGCSGCSSCTESTYTSRLVVARKAYGNYILPGDLVRVTNGFEYQRGGGPRLRYFHRRVVVGYGPGHGPEQMGRGDWSSKGGFRAVYPEFADAVEARDAREHEAEVQAQAEREATAKAEREAREAERRAIVLAREGDIVNFRGQSWVAGPEYTKLIVHSDMEYNGELCDCTAVGCRRLTNLTTDEMVEYRFGSGN